MILVAGSIFVVVWFEPHKLFIEETVNEAIPSVESAPSDAAPVDGASNPEKATNEGAANPRILAGGEFQSLEHETTGEAQVLELSDGTQFLRFEDLSTSNGPDLRVYLSEVPASDDWYAYGERYLDLGDLKGNRGDQNYEIPAGTDLIALQERGHLVPSLHRGVRGGTSRLTDSVISKRGLRWFRCPRRRRRFRPRRYLSNAVRVWFRNRSIKTYGSQADRLG